jgi:acetoin utilization deacetylase AcuC-like enzyme
VTRVGFCLDPVFLEHDAGPGHPERPERLRAVERGLREAGLAGELVPLPARAATREELLRVHTAGHVDGLAAAAGRRVRIDPDTAMSPRSHEAAVRAAGAVVGAVEQVLEGRLDRAFLAVRPPGHHATPSRAMGFCLLNNVAVGAAAALARGLERVAVIDFDVHHGNGTQEAFWTDPRVLYLSSHQSPYYPGTGGLDEVGKGEGRGFTVNLPLPAGMGDAEYARTYRAIVEPIGRTFDPELVLVSAGFDPHRDDPLGGMAVTPAGFAELVDVCLAVASGAARGRVVAVLEGGYDLDGIATSAAAVVGRLLDRPGPKRAGTAGTSAAGFEERLSAFRATNGRHWPGLTPD